MSVDLMTIGVEYRTDGLEKGTRALKANEQQANRTADAADKLGGKAQQTGQRFAALSSAVGAATGALAGLGIGALISQYTRLADTVTLMDARLRLAVKGNQEFAQSQRDIDSIARRTNAGLAETTTLYTKLNDPVRALGGGIREVAGITEAFALTLKVSGASQAEAASSTLQFAQAMAAGALRGDEFNSIAEANPRLMKALAAGMGVGVGALREMAADGKLTADVVGNALVGQLEVLRTESEQIPLTVGAAMQSVSNTVLKLTGDFDKLTGGSGNLADMIVRYATPALKGLYSVAVGVQQAFSTLGKIWGTQIGAWAAVFQGEFKLAWQIIKEGASDITDGWERAGKAINDVWSDTGDSAGYAADGMTKLTGAAGVNEKALKAAAREAKRIADEYDRLMGRIYSKEQGVEPGFLKNLKAIEAGGIRAGKSMEQIRHEQELYIKQQPFMVEQDKAKADAAKEAAKAYADYTLALDAQVMKSVEALQTAMQEEQAYGLLKSQVVELTIAKLEASKASALNPQELAATEAQIANYRQLVEVLRRGEVRDANKKAAEDAARHWDQTWGQVAESFTDNLMRGGKSVAQYLKDLFRTLVLRPILAPVGQMVANSIGGIFGAPGAGIGSTLGGLGNLAGITQSVGIGGMSIGNTVGTMWANATGGGLDALLATNGAFGTAAGGGGLMAGVGAAMPYIAAAVAIASLLSGKFKGETRMGGQYHDTQFVAGPSGGQISGATDAIAATMAAIEANLAGLGASTRVTRLVTGLEQSEKDKGFAFGGAWLSNGRTVGQGTDGMGWMNRRGSMTSEQALAAFGEELMQVRLEVIQASDAVGPLADYVRGLGDISALSGQQLQEAIGRVDKALTERAALEDRIFMLTATELEQLNRARERERAAIDSSNYALLDQIYALEDQKRAAEEAAAAAEMAAIAQEEAARAQEELARAQQQHLQDMQGGLLDAYGDLESILNGVIDKNNAYAQSLRQVRLNLTSGPGALLSPEARYNMAAAEFRRLSALPVGDEERLEKLAEAGAAFAEASQQYNASSMQYFADRDEIVRAVEASEIHAKANVDVAQLQLNAARAQLTELGLIKTGVTTLAQAQAAFNAAMQAYLAAQRTGGGLPTNPVPGQPGYVSVPSAGGIIIPSDRIIDHDQGSYIGPMTPQLPAFTPSQSAAFWGFSLNGSHASGLDYVPFDGYRAELHRGERVQTAAQARAADQTAALMQQLVNENRGLNQRVDGLTRVVATYAQRDLALGASLAESMQGAERQAKNEMARWRPRRTRE